MPDSKQVDLEECISKLHALRHEVRARLHRASGEELALWEELEPRSVEVENSARHAAGARRRAELETILTRLSELQARVSVR